MDLAGVRDLADRVRAQASRVVIGQPRAVDLLMTALLSQGHVLLEGVPGTAKTLLVRAFAAALRLRSGRIQFTPDLMPGDVVGVNLFDFRSGTFALTRGPIFTELLLADEINRTPPKTQAALLEAMQERSVTIDGTTHPLGAAFMVVATQNPIEQEGTYPLPEAQLDRFLFKVVIGYPERDDERVLVRLHGHRGTMPSVAELGVEAVAELEDLEAARAIVREIRLADPVLDYVVDLVRATRGRPTVACGASPRAATMLAAASRALAALRGRDFVVPDDVKALAVPLLRHRLVLAPGAEIEGLTAEAEVRRIVDEVAAPR